VSPLEPTPYLTAALLQLAYLTNIYCFWVILTSWERSLLQILVTFSIPRATLNRLLLEKPIVPKLIKKVLEFYKTLTSQYINLILSSTTGSCKWTSPPKPCVHLFLFYTCYMHSPAHSSLFEHPNNKIVRCTNHKTSHCVVFFTTLLSFILLDPNKFLNIIFANILSVSL
jgi:hypothetical protein